MLTTQQTQHPFTSLTATTNKKTSLDLRGLRDSADARISSSLNKANVPSQQLQAINSTPNPTPCRLTSTTTTTSESESDREAHTTNRSTSVTTVNKKSAFFKTRKKDKLKIRFELQSKEWEPGPGRYTKYPGDSSIDDRISGNHLLTPSVSSGVVSRNSKDLSYNSQTLLSSKPKRTKSLKKILTKSRSFIGIGGRDTSISRADLVARYKEKNLSKNSTLEGEQVILCKNCRTANLIVQRDVINTGVKSRSKNAEKPWLGSDSGETHFHGRYTKLPSDHGAYLSLNYHRMHQEKESFGGWRNIKTVQSPANKPDGDMGEPGVRIDYQDQYQSYYDCRIPRPKLKFLVPTHSYGVSGKSARRVDFDMSGFSEISLSDGNEDRGAYGSGSGGSSMIRSGNSSDETISEFEKEQERIPIHEGRDYISHVERIHSTEVNSPSPLGQFPSDYTALYSCEKGIVVKGSSRRLLSFKTAYLPSLRSIKTSPKRKLGEYTDFLKTLPLFRKLSNGFLAKLSDHISEASYECGEYIVRQGSRGEAFVILMSGTAKVTFLSNQTEEEIYLRTIHPGDTFGEKSLQGDKLNMLNLIANDKTVSCLQISEEGFEQLMAKSGDFRHRFSEKTLPSNNDKDVERIELEDLRLISTLGIGGFGRVELVTLASDNSRSFALKQMKKCQIVGTRQVEHIKSEKAILMETNCDFITKLYKTYKDAKYLYMLMESCLGGELWTILRDKGNFDDHTARFYVGCVLEALKYLHSKNIIYRDLKPENLLLDPKGYLKLVDFGFAKKLEGNKTWTFCGTPEYVAPEIILNKGHDIIADYWSLGVLMFELLTGTPPFVGGDPMRTYKLILKGIDFIDFPPTVGKSAYNLIRKLCQENPLDRLGAQRGGISDIKKHKWLDGLDWNALRSRSLTPPILPYVRGPHDCGNFDEYPPDRSGTPPDDLSGWDWDF